MAAGLESLAEATGRTVRLAVEPEPGCALETTAQVAAFLRDAGLGPHVGVCLDAAHLAVQFDKPTTAVAALAAAAPVVKAQVSAGLRVPDAGDPAAREGLVAFVEPRFLHQTRARAGDRVLSADDLDEALAGAHLPHLDYNLQRFGPDGPEALAAARAVDDVAGALADARASAARPSWSEYSITAVDTPVHVIRVLRAAGLLEVHAPGRDGVPRPLDVPRVRRGRPPPGGARVRPRPGRRRRRGRAGSPTTTGSTTPGRRTSPAL